MLAFFSRLPRCLVGMEACATAHYWARELSALGHEVRLMPAQYVKAYIKRNKNDAAAVVRPIKASRDRVKVFKLPDLCHLLTLGLPLG